jgi:hypothetical protein
MFVPISARVPLISFSLSFAWFPKEASRASPALVVAPAASVIVTVHASMPPEPGFRALASWTPARLPKRSAASCARRNGSSVLEMSAMSRCSSSGLLTLPSAMLNALLAASAFRPDSLNMFMRPIASSVEMPAAVIAGANFTRAPIVPLMSTPNF